MALELTRGARADAPRRDTTMTQDSDSGDAAGDARPTTDGRALWRPKVKIGLIRYPVWRFRSPHHCCGESKMRTSEPKPHWINKLPVSFDSEVGKRECRTWCELRNRDTGPWERVGEQLNCRARVDTRGAKRRRWRGGPCGRGQGGEAMRLDDLPESGNVEDRRDDGGFGGGGFGLPIGGGGLGIGAIIALGLIGWALGIDPSLLIGGAEVLTSPNRPQVQAPPTARRTA